jgi:hypothetical protein
LRTAIAASLQRNGLLEVLIALVEDLPGEFSDGGVFDLEVSAATTLVVG